MKWWDQVYIDVGRHCTTMHFQCFDIQVTFEESYIQFCIFLEKQKSDERIAML